LNDTSVRRSGRYSRNVVAAIRATVSDKRMAMMDVQMKSMRAMHEKMMRAQPQGAQH
jgi:hypothetical protein